MDERELEASNRRMLIIVIGGVVLSALALLLLFFAGKSVDAPLQDFDKEGVARFVGEGMKQVGETGEGAAAKAGTTDQA